MSQSPHSNEKENPKLQLNNEAEGADGATFGASFVKCQSSGTYSDLGGSNIQNNFDLWTKTN